LLSIGGEGASTEEPFTETLFFHSEKEQNDQFLAQERPIFPNIRNLHIIGGICFPSLQDRRPTAPVLFSKTD